MYRLGGLRCANRYSISKLARDRSVDLRIRPIFACRFCSMSLARQSLRSSFCALCRSHAPFSTSARALEEAASGPRKESTQQPSATQTPARSEAARSTGSSRRWTPSAQQRRSAVEALKDLLSGVARQGVAKDSQQGRYQGKRAEQVRLSVLQLKLELQLARKLSIAG